MIKFTSKRGQLCNTYRAGNKNQKVIRNLRLGPKNYESLFSLIRNFSVLNEKLRIAFQIDSQFFALVLLNAYKISLKQG